MALRKAHNAQALQAVSERVQEAAEVLKALSSDTRLKIMCALSAGELPVNKLAEFTGQSQSAVSQHLTKLRAAALVDSRRDGQTIYYRCRKGIAQDIIDTLCKYYGPRG
ncbi:MAG TPA: metalloregulator ArsR/SmtB family transcription factor [Hyphomonas sp.]|mgnify:CR=1 FL=1|nr:transcriptional regulator [Hyphomonas sp.]HRI99238.1 metalloregulator ArsR/SmtB family transcription factor [Hyphomonas sp.]HRK66662.1 metalloregulator ArsR/SmtB family transcription factor [Hyphomonas sp.]